MCICVDVFVFVWFNACFRTMVVDFLHRIQAMAFTFYKLLNVTFFQEFDSFLSSSLSLPSLLWFILVRRACACGSPPLMPSHLSSGASGER